MCRLRTLHFGGIVAPLLFACIAGGCGSTAPGLREGVDGAFIRAAQTWDLNHDGNVTCQEWKAYALSVFKDADVNRDGKLTPDEFARLEKIDRLFEVANFKYYDVHNQGFVTQSDFIDRPNPAFAELDKENTCVLKTYQLRAAVSEEKKPDVPMPTTQDQR